MTDHAAADEAHDFSHLFSEGGIYNQGQKGDSAKCNKRGNMVNWNHILIAV